jgi:hypothetical protein
METVSPQKDMLSVLKNNQTAKTAAPVQSNIEIGSFASAARLGPIHTLPLELLDLVLGFFREAPEWEEHPLGSLPELLLGMVCRQWRGLVTSNYRWWGSINSRNFPKNVFQAKLVEVYVQRSQNIPLSIVLIRDECFDASALMAVVLKASERWTSALFQSLDCSCIHNDTFVTAIRRARNLTDLIIVPECHCSDGQVEYLSLCASPPPVTRMILTCHDFMRNLEILSPENEVKIAGFIWQANYLRPVWSGRPRPFVSQITSLCFLAQDVDVTENQSWGACLSDILNSLTASSLSQLYLNSPLMESQHPFPLDALSSFVIRSGCNITALCLLGGVHLAIQDVSQAMNLFSLMPGIEHLSIKPLVSPEEHLVFHLVTFCWILTLGAYDPEEQPTSSDRPILPNLQELELESGHQQFQHAYPFIRAMLKCRGEPRNNEQREVAALEAFNLVLTGTAETPTQVEDLEEEFGKYLDLDIISQLEPSVIYHRSPLGH